MTYDVIGPGSLKLIALVAPDGDLNIRAVADVLRTYVSDTDIRPFGDAAWVVHTDASAAAIRDWLSPVLTPNATVFVVEFESWSAHGPAIDATWFLRRGH